MSNQVYRSGKCTVITYGPYWHELWHDHNLVATFRTFRDAVRYQLNEFPVVETGDA